MNTREQNYPKWEELTDEQQRYMATRASEHRWQIINSIPFTPPTEVPFEALRVYMMDAIKKEGRQYYNRLTRPAVDNYIDDYEEEAKEEAQVITAKAKLSDDAIGQLSSEILECKTRIIDMSFGLDWHRQNMPSIRQHEKLEQWQAETDFTKLIYELLLIDRLENERSILQNPVNREELDRIAEAAFCKLKKKWFLVDDIDSLIEKIRPLIINGKDKGKSIYAIILALWENKQLKPLGNREITELCKLFSDIFGEIGSREAINQAHKDYIKNPDGCFEKNVISNLALLLK